MTVEVHGGMSGRNQGFTARKQADTQSWHGFATSVLSHFIDSAGVAELFVNTNV